MKEREASPVGVEELQTLLCHSPVGHAPSGLWRPLDTTLPLRQVAGRQTFPGKAVWSPRASAPGGVCDTPARPVEEQAQAAWRTRGGAMEGGSAASCRCRRIFRITVPCVMAAMICSDPC